MNKTVHIGNALVGDGCEPFVIAEAGINHNGDISLAKKMIEVAAESGVDAVKFQTFRTEDFIFDHKITYTYQSQGKEVTESMFDMFKRTEFSREEWGEIKDCCDNCGITFLSTPVTVHDLEMLIGLGTAAVKVGSDDFTNIPFIKEYASKGLPMLISCGMADGDEIEQVVNASTEINDDLCIFLCTSQYPTPPENANISKLEEMRRRFPDVVLGFSDHTQGSTAAVLAVGYGAKVFEKHFTLSHDFPGPDHWFASDPDELREWASSIKEAYEMVGSPDLVPTPAEREMRSLARRSVVVVEDVEEGEVFSVNNLGLRRPGTGIPPSSYESILGRIAAKAIKAGALLEWDDLA
ncbi:N-acetylneuraminate synthase family protein [Paraeggerthella sp.]|uniref:N-acetylneuraminate synthase family protein n=1 Tax=Paraeggerthella sp. TaxID=2897350 RepID=UPI003A941CF8